MKLIKIKIHFRAFGMDNQTMEINKLKGFGLPHAEKFIKRYTNCKTSIVYSIEIDGEIIYNEKYEPFQVVGKSQNLIKKI